jgi:hypothetical protein
MKGRREREREREKEVRESGRERKRKSERNWKKEIDNIFPQIFRTYLKKIYKIPELMNEM